MRGASVSARLFGPDRVTRDVPLPDDGDHGDGAAGDGLYGARVAWDVPGSHTVTVVVSGSTRFGAFRVEDRVTFSDRRGVDADDDGLPDEWERRYKPRCACGLNPLSDSDGDGLDNRTEWRFGSHPLRADTDGDGASDADEFEAGTSPADPDDRPAP